ncbi:outer membrane beta-barrel family protein [Mucilaginibacter phyllosphaerae]|uniref:Outer membrane receptor protein involved in Fe transport n=1 Tax=Mucilaginibacter phyllosphaerae TaxID=1812349 RepID=A0A4Y8ALS8_9SPHI|nr:outer membrane beta-barrel family protein [Mucilaginibacter phyllosphaerae]MBB3967591.1 outer membrane receptor protein involved in Fe transport [Mucilaginibacter phyllosphaerae]TEW69351.1 TonB-dependent receptor [Mucilaginibacter phyllosphaerae]GGH21579.1 TonB-dependent receptor [Mucilaginibacter phyllosphaerae]
MKRIFLLLIVICTAVLAKAQIPGGGGGSSIVGKISGTVIDSLTKKPVDYATISLFKSGAKSPVNGVLTDEKGNFKIDNVRAGKYKITISFIGYPTKTFDPVETTAAKPDNNMGTLVLAPSAKALKEVQIVGQQALVENRIDKIVYNAEKDLTAAGGNATDVLQKVPLVSVDMNGNVAIRGDQNVRVLINGKPSGATSASLSDVLKTIPADQIKNIEVITSPSAKYDAEGSGGIINIITKTKNASGISGSVSGGVGTRQNNGNVNLNYNKNRFNFSANLGGNLTWPQTSTTLFDQTIQTGAVNQRNVNNTSNEIKRHGARGTLTAGYEFNGFNSINSTLALNDGGFNANGGGTYSIKDLIDSTKNLNYIGKTGSKNKFSGFDWNVDYTHKFKKEGHEITVSGQWSHSIIKTDYTSLFSARQPSQKGDNNGKNNEYTAQADYTLPISKTLKLEAGGKTIQRRINSVYNIYSVDYPNGDNPILDTENSNLYNYNQNVYAGYSVFTITLPKSYSLLAGFRYENTRIKGDPETPFASGENQQVLSPFSASYNTYVPSLTLQKVFGANTLKLSYSKRIQRPSLQVLNPFINRSSIQAQSVGNPNLAPEVSQTVELNYNTYIKSSVINFSVYYKRTNDLIEGIARPITEIVGDSTVNGTRTEQNNVARNNSVGASFFGSITPFKALTIRANINLFTYNPTVYAQYAGFVNQDALKTRLMSTMFGSAQLTLPKNFIVEAFGFTNSARRTIQGTSPAFGIYAFGIKKQFMDKKASIGFNTVQPFAVNKSFNQNISSPGFTQVSSTQFPFQSFGITFSYSFGKISFSNPQQKKKKGVNNDDQIQGGDQTGGGAPAGGR